MALVFILAGAFCAMAQDVPSFRDGDRVVYVGDSITDGGHYHSYIWLFYATRFPWLDLRMYNGGIGGEVSGQMLARLDDDILSKNPSYITLSFGMNDTGYLEYKKEGAKEFGERRFNESMDSYKKIVKRFLAMNGIRFAMIGGSPYDQEAVIKDGFGPLPGKNEVMQRISDEQKKDAEANGWGFVDFNRPMLEMAARQREKEPSFTFTGGDRVHPDNAGHMVMAYLFLKAQGMAGNKVAEARLDGRKGSVEMADNCEITNILKNRNEIRFDYLANALPCPLDTISHGNGLPQAAAADMVPFVEEMNQEILAISGLSGKWKVLIDGEEIGQWNGAELAKGVNLAEISWTPQYQQALKVMYVNEFRWEIEKQFRDVAWMQYDALAPAGVVNFENRHAVEEMDRLKAGNGWIAWHRPNFAKYIHEDIRKIRWQEMESLADKMYELNKPVIHKVTVKKVTGR
jgi:lysophospholipase L1-like esterase